MKTKCARVRLLATTATTAAALSALIAVPAVAQDAPPEATAEVGELVVTGSRLPRPNLEQPTPVAVQRVEDYRAPLALGDIIARLPQAGFSGTLRANSNNFGTRAGINAINLRNLGVSRTLVLVDGQRHVAGDLFSNAVDVNSIPPALVDRVEVTTGGASAVYGSDAVTGVVNIITRKRFEGLQVDATGGRYDAGFGGRYSASATAGKNFLDDRLNVTVSGFWRKDQAIDASDIPAANNYGTIINPADLALGASDPSFATGFRFTGPTIPNNGVPERQFVPNVGSELTTRYGVLINAINGAAIVFNAAGQPVATPRRTGYNAFGFGQLPAGCEVCYFPEDYKEVSSRIETGGFAFKTSYEFTPGVRAFVDAKFVQSDVDNNIQPSLTAGEYLLRADNAFLTPAIGLAISQIPGTPAYVFSRWLNDGRSQDIRRRTYRMVAGLEGDWAADFADVKWDASFNYGETGTRIRYNDLLITQNFAAALDSVINPATGRPACRINVPTAPQTGQGAGALNRGACVPYNPFGLQNSPEAMAYSFGNFATKDRLTQQVINLNASFDTGKFLNLQGGPVGVAMGGEYRMERTRSRSDALLTSGGADFTATNSSGGYNVVEGYLELSAPLFRDAGPMMDELTIDGAIRGADYSTVGKVAAYKLGAIYGPTSWLKLRGGWSRSVRAPNITEAFSPLSSTFFLGVRDPCSAENINTNVNFARNCAAAGLPPGFVATSSAAIPGTVSGNAGLDAEKSRSYTLGFVVQPPQVPNLAVTLDYYSIRIKDAVTLVGAQQIVDNCYGSSAGLDPTFCGLLARAPGARPLISGINTTYVNAAKLFTDGFELQVSYATDVARFTEAMGVRSLDGQLRFNLTADYVVSLRNYPFQQNPGDVNVLEGVASSIVGFGNNPQLKAMADLAYVQGPVTVGWTTRYIGRQALFSRDPSQAQRSETLSIPFAEPTFYHDLSVSYRLDGGGYGGLELFAGAQNLFDEEPPFTVLGSPRDAAFDLGRFLYVGARFRR